MLNFQPCVGSSHSFSSTFSQPIFHNPPHTSQGLSSHQHFLFFSPFEMLSTGLKSALETCHKVASASEPSVQLCIRPFISRSASARVGENPPSDATQRLLSEWAAEGVCVPRGGTSLRRLAAPLVSHRWRLRMCSAADIHSCLPVDFHINMFSFLTPALLRLLCRSLQVSLKSNCEIFSNRCSFSLVFI